MNLGIRCLQYSTNGGVIIVKRNLLSSYWRGAIEVLGNLYFNDTNCQYRIGTFEAAYSKMSQLEFKKKHKQQNLI